MRIKARIWKSLHCSIKNLVPNCCLTHEIDNLLSKNIQNLLIIKLYKDPNNVGIPFDEDTEVCEVCPEDCEATTTVGTINTWL